jgi:hypothetical protein
MTPKQGESICIRQPRPCSEITYMVNDSLDAINVVFDDDRSVIDVDSFIGEVHGNRPLQRRVDRSNTAPRNRKQGLFHDQVWQWRED